MQGIGKLATRDTIRVWRKDIHLAKLEMGVALPFSGMKIKYEAAKELQLPELRRKTAA